VIIKFNGAKMNSLYNNRIIKYPFLFLICILLILFSHSTIFAKKYQNVSILIGEKATQIEINVSDLLAIRLKESGLINSKVFSENTQSEKVENRLIILLGIPGHHKLIDSLFNNYRLPELTLAEPGPEGFLLKFIKTSPTPILLAAGVDERGCLYAVGELLRQAKSRDG